jgi:hypothetical protein
VVWEGSERKLTPYPISSLPPLLPDGYGLRRAVRDRIAGGR